MEKIIPVDEENIEKAKEKALQEFNDNELTSEYLETRNIEVEENKLIKFYAYTIAKLIIKNNKYSTKDEVKEFIDQVLKKSEISNYIFDETIKKLEQDYNISFNNISI